MSNKKRFGAPPMKVDDALTDKLIRLAQCVRRLEQKEGYNLPERLSSGEYTTPPEVDDLLQAVLLVGDDNWKRLMAL